MEKGNSKVYLGADHAGFELKEKIKWFLEKKGIICEDVGTFDGEKSVDYPDFAFKLGERVAEEKDAKGILVCGAGIGMSIAANKVKGIRAALVYDDYGAKMSRQHNDANVICLRGRDFPASKALKLLWAWLNEEFGGEERHARRVGKIKEYEENGRWESI